MVQVVMGFLDDAPNMDTRLSIIETLRTVTEGKVDYAKSSGCLTRFAYTLRRSLWRLSAPV